jgi:hypothetical protein
MASILRYFLLVGALMFAGRHADAATYSIPIVRDVEAKSGVPVFLENFIDCRTHTPFEGRAFVQHGTVTMKHVTIDYCSNSKEPANQYWYTSNPGFRGMDEVNFPLASGSALIVHLTVR